MSKDTPDPKKDNPPAVQGAGKGAGSGGTYAGKHNSFGADAKPKNYTGKHRSAVTDISDAKKKK